MSDPDRPPSPDALVDHLTRGDHDEAAARLTQLGDAPAERRKEALRAVRSAVAERSAAVGGVADHLAGFLTDEDRAVRLTTAKLFVASAETDADSVLSVVDELRARLDDDDEFYYVRARCAEALGYVALEHPGEVSDPETLADLRIGLSFDEPEVKEKLAKALAYVALGDPDRLRHQVASLADHLEDDRELVRYHLCTALVVVGCERPAKLAQAEDALRERLGDENPYVRGRAVEALALLAEAAGVGDRLAEETAGEDAPSFLVERLRFAQRVLGESSPNAGEEVVGTVDSVQDSIEDAAAAVSEPEDGAECSHCGAAMPEAGPPLCPQCGAPDR